MQLKLSSTQSQVIGFRILLLNSPLWIQLLCFNMLKQAYSCISNAIHLNWLVFIYSLI